MGAWRTFTFQTSVLVKGTPTEVFDKASGDISEWWDHSMSGESYRLYVEPKPRVVERTWGHFLGRLKGFCE